MDMTSSICVMTMLNMFIFWSAAAAVAEELPKPLALKTNGRRKPVITEQPKSCFSQGSAVRLYCDSDGFPEPKISWLRNGVSLTHLNERGIVKMSDKSLLFVSIQNEGKWQNTGIYQCVASNELGKVFSHNATVEVAHIDDEFRREPTDKIAAVGAKTTIECKGPRGAPEPTITWEKDSQLLINSSRVQILSSGNLYFSRLQLSDTGSYECIATNDAGTKTSTAAYLMVQEPPRVEVNPSSRTVRAGEAVEATCQVEANPLLRKVWSKKSGILSSRFTSTRDGFMRISEAEVEDSGEYICTATNRVGSQSASVVITVEDEPEIVEVEAESTVQIGETITLPCRARGSPPPTITWRDPSGNEMFVGKSYQNGHILIDAEGSLVVFSAKSQDDGLYGCEAVNTIGATMRDVRLNVRSSFSHGAPPKLFLVPANTTAPLRSTVVLECSSKSRPTTTIEWFKEDRPVGTSSSYGRITLLSSGSLKITNLQEQDAGQYSCRASNNYGITEWRAWITIGTDSLQFSELPATPGRPAFVNSSSTSITISWTSELVPPTEYFIVEYYRVEASSSSWKRISPVAQPICKVENLLPSSDYVFFIRSVNQREVSKPSPDSSSMRTKDPIISTSPPNAKSLESVSIRILRAEPSHSTTMLLAWESSEECDVIDGFMVIAQTATIPTQKLLTQQVSCSDKSTKLSGLKEGMKYEVRVRPVRKTHTGPASPIVFVSLVKGLIEPTPLVLTSHASENEIDLEWSSPSDLPTLYVTGYSVHYRSRDGAINKLIRTNSTTTKLTLKSVQTDKYYIVTVAYMTQLGPGATSEEETISFEGIEHESDLTTLLKQPAFIAGVAVAVFVIILIIIGICWYRRSRRPGSRRGNPKDVGGQNDKDLFRLERIPMMPANASHSNNDSSVCYNAKNGEVTSNIHAMSSAGAVSTKPNFSYVADQLTSKNNIQPQFSRPSVSAPQHHQPFLQQNHQERQMSTSNNLYSSDDVANNATYYPDFRSAQVPTNFRPPPSPPLSHKTGVSDKSQSSSGVRSTSDRSTRSGQSSRYPTKASGVNNNRPNPAMEASSRLHGSQPPFGNGFHDDRQVFAPPTPPKRDESMQGYGPSEQDPRINRKLDRGGAQQFSSNGYHPGYNPPTNKGKTVNMSWGNGYGSESDVRESSCEHESSSYASDEDSVDMSESVSQVGQNRLHPIHEMSQYEPTNSKSYEHPSSSLQVNYTDRDPLLPVIPGHRSPVEVPNTSVATHASSNNPIANQGLNGNVSAGSNDSKDGQNLKAARSQNPERSKLNLTSHAQQFRPNEAPAFLELEISNALNGQRHQSSGSRSPSSPTESAVSEQSGYMSTASSCWQFQLPSPSKNGSYLKNSQVINGRLPVMERPSDGMKYPFPTSKPELKFPNPSRTVANPNHNSVPNNYSNGLSQFQNAKMGLAKKISSTYPHERVENKTSGCPVTVYQNTETSN